MMPADERRQDPVARMWRERLAEISAKRAWARAIWIAIALLVSWLHLFVHAVRIDHDELILDEAGTWGVARQSLTTLITLPTEFHSQPPLYYFVLHAIIGIDDSTWFLRMSSWFFCLLMLQFVLFYLHELNLVSRVALCLLLIYSDMFHFLATTVRPYAMAALLTLIASVYLLRLCRQPNRHTAIAYVVAALAMLWTMAFEVAVLLSHGLFVLAVCLVWSAQELNRAPRVALRAIWQRCRWVLGAMTAVVVGYLPYLAMAIHYQYTDTGPKPLDKILERATYVAGIDAFFRWAPAVTLAVYGLCVIALVRALCSRDRDPLLWTTMVICQIAFVHYFVIGHTVLLPHSKYMSPAFVAICALAAFGFQELAPTPRRSALWATPLLLGWIVYGGYEDFKKASKEPTPVGQFELMRREVLKHPGPRGIFFEVGYEGQYLEYFMRNDPGTNIYTMRGRSWAAGGAAHLDDAYVRARIAETATTARCFFYYRDLAMTGKFAEVFAPEMQRRGFVEVPPLPQIHGREVRGFCRS